MLKLGFSQFNDLITDQGDIAIIVSTDQNLEHPSLEAYTTIPSSNTWFLYIFPHVNSLPTLSFLIVRATLQLSNPTTKAQAQWMIRQLARGNPKRTSLR